MYQLLATPLPVKAKSILHIVDSREISPEILSYINSIPCESKQILKLGETYLQTPGFRSFKTVMVHDTKTPTRQWELIKKFGYDERLRECAKSDTRLYIGIGYGAALLQRQSTMINTSSPGGKNLTTPLLGIMKRRIIMQWDPSVPDHNQFRQLMALSMMDNYYLFPNGTGYTSHDKNIQGTIYLARMGNLYEVKMINGKRITQKLRMTI